MSIENWRWDAATTGEPIYVDQWWHMIDKAKSLYPNTYLTPEDEATKGHLLRDEIKWGISDTNKDFANAPCTVNFAGNNSPQFDMWVGGRRRERKEFVIMEMSYRFGTGSITDTYKNPPLQYMKTKKILGDVLTSNYQLLWDRGGTRIHQPSVIQDGKSFGNFGMMNAITTPINMFSDNQKWKYILLFMIEILEDLT